MLTIWGARQAFCDGISRRGFLQVGAFGAGLTLAELLRSRAHGGTAGRAKSAILIYLPGGPSHIDMYDPKPEAPVEFRGEFKSIETSVPGVRLCEHFPLQAAMWDRLACVRSVVSVNEHSDTLVMTGTSDQKNRTAHQPSFGAVVSRVRSRSDEGSVPPFISLRGMSRGTEPGFLGVAHRPFTVSGPGLANLRLGRGMTADRLDDRKALLEGFDGLRRDIDASGTMSGMDAFTARAFDVVTSGAVRNALDLAKVDAKTRQRYKGVEQFLTARRLVEAGAGCVTLSIGGWDTHGNNFKTLARQLPLVDRGVANLVNDLHEAGLADDVVTVMWGEFGRTPRVNRGAGRDHWPQVMSALVAGGGLKMGQAVGASSARGEYPRDRRYTVPQVLSTLYRCLGIDPAQTFVDGSGRPRYVLEDREPVAELL